VAPHREFATIDTLSAAAYTVPTDKPESDGTMTWTSTTIVVVEVRAGGRSGLGYTYASPAAAVLVNQELAGAVEGQSAVDTGRVWSRMVHGVRNIGRPGVASQAISAVDIALWDLKARLLDVPVATLTPSFHQEVPVYGSGGFTSYTPIELQEQLGGWVARGIPRVKMKVGRDPSEDHAGAAAAREAIGEAALYVDANGAWSRKQALSQVERFADLGVSWLEEPVSSDDLHGLHLIRDRAPAGMDVAAGEYGYDLPYFRRMLDAGAVDCLQADVTRCGGITPFLGVAALCDAHGWTCPRTPPRASARTPAPGSGTCATSSTSMTTSGSSTCSSMVCSTRSRGRCDPTRPARDSVSSSRMSTRSRSAWSEEGDLMSVPRRRLRSIAVVAAVIAVMCVLLSAPARRLLFVVRPPGGGTEP
jgi:L-alanine-DL-glutamate epimerase-like enolase superfamily enzyme